MPCPLCSPTIRQAIRDREPVAENFEPQKPKEDGSFREAYCPDCRCRGRHRVLAKWLLEHGIEADASAPALLCGAEPEETAMLGRHFADITLITKYPDPELYPGAIVADITHDLPFEDGQFGYFLASGVFDYVPEQQEAFRQMRRVMRPGGLALIQIQPARLGEYDEPIRVKHHNALRHEGYAPTLEDGTTGIPHCLFDRSSVVRHLDDAGFDAHVTEVADPISPLTFEIFVGRAR